MSAVLSELTGIPDPPRGFNWKNPDYFPIIQARWDRMRQMEHPRTGRALVRNLMMFYKHNPVHFINDWGVTADPRNAMIGKMVVMPFVLFPRQWQWCHWLLGHMEMKTPGLTEKSRDCGVSWLMMSMFATLGIFNNNVSFGVGSEKEDKIDRTSDPDCLFWKARFFLDNLPPHFKQDYSTAHMRISLPKTNSSITGEAGSQIGRGGRKTAYGLDEAAHIPQGEAINQSLASNTECRIDVSSVAGMANSFAIRRHSGKVDVFTFSWMDDPRKGPEWREQMVRDHDSITIKQEVDMDYKASVEGQIIVAEHIMAAIGALSKLGLERTGRKLGALDVADEGVDKNAYAGRHGIELCRMKQWSGKGSDPYKTTVEAFECCDEFGSSEFFYDADGLGAFVRGDGNAINEARRNDGRVVIEIAPFRGSGAVDDPEGELVPERLNKDYFANLKAQSWWFLKILFQNTYYAVVEGREYDPDLIISIDPDLPELSALVLELCQPTYTRNLSGKLLVDKQPTLPDGRMTKSPNMADAVMMLYNPTTHAMDSWNRLAGLQ